MLWTPYENIQQKTFQKDTISLLNVNRNPELS
jgi:hypothetical protein